MEEFAKLIIWSLCLAIVMSVFARVLPPIAHVPDDSVPTVSMVIAP
jgi:hypothetical protein